MSEISVLTALGPRDDGYVHQAYASIRLQAAVDWQWIVVVDGQFPTPELDAIESDDRLSITRLSRNQGPAAARNIGATLVNSPIIRNLDIDDEIATPSVLKRTVQIFKNHPKVMFSGGAMIDRIPDGSLRNFHERIPGGYIPPGYLYDFWIRSNRFGAVHPTSLSVRTKSFFEAGGYPALAASEDTALLFSLNRSRFGWFDNETVTIHSKRPDSITASDWYSSDPTKLARDLFVMKVGNSEH